MRSELDCGQAEQEIGEIEAGLGDGLAVRVDPLVSSPLKLKAPRELAIGERVLLHPRIAEART